MSARGQGAGSPGERPAGITAITAVPGWGGVATGPVSVRQVELQRGVSVLVHGLVQFVYRSGEEDG